MEEFSVEITASDLLNVERASSGVQEMETFRVSHPVDVA